MMKSALSVLNTVIDAILPRRARFARTAERSAADIPLLPTVHDLLGAKITTLMDYREEAVHDAVQSLKYDGSPHAARILSEVLADYLREEIASKRMFSTKKILVVPVPLHKDRVRERGFNQIARVFDALPDDLRAFVAPEILVRTRATKQQTRLLRHDRLSNVAGAFSAPNQNAVKGAVVYVIDDVTTTGATLLNAGNALRRAGAEVTLIALARA